MQRFTFADAARRPLYFARVWEDPLLELEAFAPRANRTYVLVGSGGCTALSLLAAGASRVVAVDINPTQNDLSELKAALLQRCDPDEAIAFLGHTAMSAGMRRAIYHDVRSLLGPSARTHWDQRLRAIGRGVERSGMTERITRLIAALTRTFVHPTRRIEALLAQPTLSAQRDYYDRVWNSRRWRMMIALLGNRTLIKLAYKPVRYQHQQPVELAEFYARVFEHAVTALPITDNYFLHQVFLGRYPDSTHARPPYLDPLHTATLRANIAGLSFVDGSFTTYLRQCPSRSIDGFALSNICEWMTPAACDELFAEIARTAAPDAVVCFRNNFGHTEVPPRWRTTVIEDCARSAEMSLRDRSVVTPRFAVCRVRAQRRLREVVEDRRCTPEHATPVPS